MKTISELKEDISGGLHGTSLKSVWNIDSIIYRAISKVMAKVDFPESKHVDDVEEGIVGGITRYKAPKLLKGNKIIALKKYRKDCYGKDLYTDYCQDYIRHTMPSSQYYENDKSLSIENINGFKYLNVKGLDGGCGCDTCKKALIHSMDSFSCDYCTEKGCEVKNNICSPVCMPCTQYPTSNAKKSCNDCDECENPPQWKTTGDAGGLKIVCSDYLTGKGATSLSISI